MDIDKKNYLDKRSASEETNERLWGDDFKFLIGI